MKSASKINIEGKLILVMGVAGCGKSALAKNIAQNRKSLYMEADDFHSDENIKRMGRGLPLGDKERQPWLQAIVKELQSRLGEPEIDEVVLACSALRQVYRDTLSAAAKENQLIYLKASLPEARQRVAERADHFFPAVLVQDQFMVLEEPEGSIVVDAELPLETQIRLALASLDLES